MTLEEEKAILTQFVKNADIEVIDTLRDRCHFYETQEVVEYLLEHGKDE